MSIPIVEIARVCHEANRAYCATIGDDSQVPWFDAPDWQRDSAENGVRAISDNRRLTPEDSHEGWLEEKIEDGWKWGEVKDPEKKLHPCMMPYFDLPEEQKVKDHLFQAVARALLG